MFIENNNLKTANEDLTNKFEMEKRFSKKNQIERNNLQEKINKVKRIEAHEVTIYAYTGWTNRVTDKASKAKSVIVKFVLTKNKMFEAERRDIVIWLRAIEHTKGISETRASYGLDDETFTVTFKHGIDYRKGVHKVDILNGADTLYTGSLILN